MPWYRRYRTKYRTSRTIDPQPRIVVPFVPWAHRDQKNVEQHGAKEARGHGFLGVPTYPHHDTCTHFKDGVHTCICQFESSVRVDTGLVAHRWLVRGDDSPMTSVANTVAMTTLAVHTLQPHIFYRLWAHSPRRNWSATPSMTLLTFAAWLDEHTSRMEHPINLLAYPSKC